MASVLGMRITPALPRFVCAVLLALILGLRLLGATGYMPNLDNGVVRIVACPDAAADAPLAINIAHHHHGHSKHKHDGQCPYASAAALGALGPEFPALASFLIFAAALLLRRTSLLLERNRLRERPPSRAPPLSA